MQPGIADFPLQLPLNFWGPVLSVFLGILAGCVFFLGLWWTVRHKTQSPGAGLWFVGGFFLRLILTLFLLLPTAGRLLSVLAWIAGFLLVRLVTTRVLGPGKNPQQPKTQWTSKTSRPTR